MIIINQSSHSSIQHPPHILTFSVLFIFRNSSQKVLEMADVTTEECKLLSGGFAALMQVMLGFIAFSVLILKRYNEVPQRPLAVRCVSLFVRLVQCGFARPRPSPKSAALTIDRVLFCSCACACVCCSAIRHAGLGL